MNARDFIPIPDIESGQRYVVFQPHSDDAALFAGGLIARLTGSGKHVTLVTMTDGCLGTCDPAMSRERLVRLRREEDQKAGEILSVQNHLYLPFHDGSLPHCGATTLEMVRIIRQEQPDAIMVPDPWLPYESHQDHLNCGWSGTESVIYAALPLYLPEVLPAHAVSYVILYLTDKPNQFVDITSVHGVKTSALASYPSQFSPEQYQMVVQYLDLKAADIGAAHGIGPAEAYKVLTPLHLHTSVDSAGL
jgi:LmbE family N-acetylglucosaminyl deacetylase